MPDEPYEYGGHSWASCVWEALEAEDVSVASYLADLTCGGAGLHGWPTAFSAWATFFAQRIVAARREADERRNPRRY